jgi:DNA primase
MNRLTDYIDGLKKKAGTRGGEWKGPCPWCGGTDRFWVHPHYGETGEYKCRQCGRGGDGIDYLREARGMTFPEACEALSVEHKLDDDYQPSDNGSKPATPAPRRPRTTAAQPPSERWREQAASFVDWCTDRLWSEAGSGALQWLRSRGFRDAALRSAKIGYNPETRFEEPSAWDVDREHHVLPDGILIPWIIEGDVWKLNMRLGRDTRNWYREQGDTPPKYRAVTGSRNALYGANLVQPERPVVLVEGELDALTVNQEAWDVASAVATGSTGGGRALRWKVRLQRASTVLVAFDNDAPGEEASAWWLDALPNARRWRPYWGDVNDLLTGGEDVAAWVRDGLQDCDRITAIA